MLDTPIGTATGPETKALPQERVGVAAYAWSVHNVVIEYYSWQANIPNITIA